LAGIGTDAYKNVEGVIGSAFNDTITGSSGNDTLRGGAGDDALNEGAGIDLLDFSDVATGFSITLGAGGSGTVSVHSTDSYSNMEGVVGGNGNDTISGNVSRCFQLHSVHALSRDGGEAPARCTRQPLSIRVLQVRASQHISREHYLLRPQSRSSSPASSSPSSKCAKTTSSEKQISAPIL
jgi:hypothetical protein